MNFFFFFLINIILCLEIIFRIYTNYYPLVLKINLRKMIKLIIMVNKCLTKYTDRDINILYNYFYLYIISLHFKLLN